MINLAIEKHMNKLLLFTVSVFMAGCQSTHVEPRQTKQIENYSQIICTVKKQNVGNFNGVIVFDKGLKTMSIGDDVMNCTSDKMKKCKAKIKTKNGYQFYSVNVYTYKYPGSGFLDTAEISNNMLTNASYAELECNRQ
jgi:hypothetical protein